MQIKIISKPEEVKSVEKHASELVIKGVINSDQAKQLCAHEHIHEAHDGFVVIGENTEDGSYAVTIKIPEWVTVESLEVIVGHLDEVVTIAAAIKAAASAIKILLKGLKRDFQNLWEKHNLPGKF